MLLRLVLVLVGFGMLVVILPRLYTALYAWPRLFSVSDTPVRRVAIVFGAGLRRDGSPSPILRDRLATAADLYFQGKVEKLLMSGDSSFPNYNEPEAMREFAMRLGVPADDIVVDNAGRRTYDTCFRAKKIFGLDEAILVTQNFHLPRALYTCNRLELPAIGVAANRRTYNRLPSIYYHLREIAATFIAVWEVHISHPSPALGNPDPIFPSKAQ